MQVSTQTDVGNKRSTNEDSVYAESFDSERLLVVADGMGGHAAGDVASDLATTELSASIEAALASNTADYETILAEAITSANVEIRELADSDPERSGMGTTVVAALVGDDETVIANVGDSRAYQIGDDIEQITVDQSFVQELVEQGEITPEEAEDHPQRNVISQSLGTSEEVEPDFYTVSGNSSLLLCSDGLTEEVADERIREIVAEASDIDSATSQLIDAANDNGGSDNISVVLASESSL